MDQPDATRKGEVGQTAGGGVGQGEEEKDTQGAGDSCEQTGSALSW